MATQSAIAPNLLQFCQPLCSEVRVVHIGLVISLEAVGVAIFGPEVESWSRQSWAWLHVFLTVPFGGMMLRSA